MNARIGIDFGGVIVRNLHQDTGEDTSLQSSSGEHAARDGAFDAIRQLCSACDGRVWIVSKAGPRMQERTLTWLQCVDFFSRTGLQPDHVHFCLQREDKALICRELEISHFIDDRVHVMQILRGVVPHLCLFGEPGGERFCPPWASFASSWSEVVDLWLDPPKPTANHGSAGETLSLDSPLPSPSGGGDRTGKDDGQGSLSLLFLPLVNRSLAPSRSCFFHWLTWIG